jgi:hypothetical protein
MKYRNWLFSPEGDGSGGTNTSSGGAGDNPNDNSGDSGQKPQTVSYETHQKLLREKKVVAERAAAAEARLQKMADDELKAKEEYKTLYERTKSEFDLLNSTLNESVKLRSFMDLIPGQVPKKYWDLIDLSDVPMDPETRQPDSEILNKKAKEFTVAFPEVIQKPNTVKLSNEAARGASTRLTYEEWTKLPLAEQKIRMKDVDKSTL